MKLRFLKHCHVMVVAVLGLSQLVSSAGDFVFYSVGKGQYYDQTGGGTPISKLPLPQLFYAQVVQQSSGLSSPVFSVTLRSTSWPVSQTRSLRASGSPPGFPSTFGDRHPTPGTLNTNYPDGDYQFKIFTLHDGQQTVTVTLNDGSYPPVPTIQNLTEAQSVDPTNDFTLNWETFSGATEADFIFLQLQRSGLVYFNTAYVPGTAGALNGTNTSITIPAGTLQPGRAYLGRLVFAYPQGISTNAYPGAWGTGFLFTQTDFWLKTQGLGDSSPPAVVSTVPVNGSVDVPTNTTIAFKFSEAMSPNGISLRASGVPGSGPSPWLNDQTIFLIETSGLSAGSSPLVILNPFDGLAIFRDLSGNPLPSDTILTFTAGSNRITPTPALLTNAQQIANQTFAIDLIGKSNCMYTLQYSETYSNWVNLQTNITFDGKASFIDTNKTPTSSRIYRALAR